MTKTNTKSKSEEETKAVAVAEQGSAPSNAAPSFMDAYIGAGAENISGDDMETPRIKLLQALSPEVEQFDEAKPGHFWHTIAQVDLGPQLKVVPVHIDMRAILWNPRESGGGILARSDDLVKWSPDQGEFRVKVNKGTKEVTWKLAPLVAASKLLDWGSSDPGDPNSQPAATKMYNVAVALVDYPELGPAVLTLQRSTVKAAKKFLSQLKLVRAPIFGCQYVMASQDEKNSNNQGYKGISFRANGMVQVEEEFHRYRGYYDMFKEMGLKIRDIEGLAEDDSESAGTVSTDPNAPAY